MSTLNKLAAKAAQEYAGVSGNAQAAIDPATIVTFITLIMDIIKQIKECRDKKAAAAAANANAVQTVKSPGVFQRMRLRKHVKDSMSKKDFRDHGEQVIQSLLQTGSKSSKEEIEGLLKEVN